jgi:TolB protein
MRDRSWARSFLGVRRRLLAGRLPHHASRLALLMALLAGCAISLPGQPAPPPPPRVAFVTTEYAVATISATGGQATIISPSLAPGAKDSVERRYAWPAWSPDGQRVAFMAIDDGGASGAILVAGADSTNRVTIHELPSNYPIYLSWSPDGTTVSMLTSGVDTLHLLLGDASGRGAAREVTTGQPLFSSWAPDSQSLLVHDGSALYTIAARPPQTGPATSIQREAVNVDPSAFRAPAWSPTGAFQVMAGDDGIGGDALYLRDRDGQVRLLAETNGLPAFVWSPTGDHLAWTAALGPFLYDGLHVGTLDGNNPQRIVDEPVLAFFWSPDGAHIAYLTLTEDGSALDWCVVPVTGGSVKTVASFAPSREFIQLVTFFDQYAQSVALWSPDSRSLIFTGWQLSDDLNSPPSIYIVPADGSTPARALTHGHIGFFAPPPVAPRR